MRIRTIKPEFFTHEALFEAEKETGLPLRVAFVGLWCAADREGRFRWQPRRLGVQLLPYDQVDFSRVLHACITRGFVVAYRVNGEVFGVIPSFTKHQVINNREAESVLPAHDAENAELLTNLDEIDACPTRAPRVPHATLTCTSGREGKGREGKGKEGVVDSEDSKISDLTDSASELLSYLNEKAGRSFRNTPENIGLITLRLKEVEGDVAGCKKMIDRQVARWASDPQMSEYLRPHTLFNKTKFQDYYDNRDLPANGANEHGNTSTGGLRNGQLTASEQRNANIGGFDAEEQRRQARIREEADNPPKFPAF